MDSFTPQEAKLILTPYPKADIDSQSIIRNRHYGMILNNDLILALYSDDTYKYISESVRKAVKDKIDRDIIPSRDVVFHLLDSLRRSYQPHGETYGGIPSYNPESAFDQLRNRTVEMIYRAILNEYIGENKLQEYSIWSTMYGDQNRFGLRQHAPIKVQHKRPMLGLKLNFRY